MRLRKVGDDGEHRVALNQPFHDLLGLVLRTGELLGAGLNLAGIAMVLYLETENARLRQKRRPSHGSH